MRSFVVALLLALAGFELVAARSCLVGGVSPTDDKQFRALPEIRRKVAAHLGEQLDLLSLHKKKTDPQYAVGTYDEIADPADYGGLNLDWITQCDTVVTYQHGQMSYWGVPTFQVGRQQKALIQNADAPQRIIIEVLKLKYITKPGRKLYYIGQCSEYVAFKMGELMGIPTAVSDKDPVQKKNLMDAALERLNLWSAACTPDTKIAILFVKPGTKSESEDNGDGFIDIWFKKYAAAKAAGKGLVDATADANTEIQGLEGFQANPTQVLCREPKIHTKKIVAAARNERNTVEQNFAHNVLRAFGCSVDDPAPNQSTCLQTARGISPKQGKVLGPKF